jgi:rRNA maturation RNase YbeY
MAKINFYFQAGPITLSNRKILKMFIAQMIVAEDKPLNQLNIIFCSDAYLLKINRKYLRHNFYTDVITFNLSSDNKQVTGEIYISAERVKENAVTLRVEFQQELHRIIFHGVLHLCGFSDHTLPKKRVMQVKENQYLDIYFSLNDAKINLKCST